jgi:hypothetical protein
MCVFGGVVVVAVVADKVTSRYEPLPEAADPYGEREMDVYSAPGYGNLRDAYGGSVV